MPCSVMPQAQPHQTFMKEIPIKVGQVYGDCDERKRNRFLLVEVVGETHVHCQVLRTGKKTTIRKDRLTPSSTGFFLAMDPEVLVEVQKQLSEAKNREAAIQSSGNAGVSKGA
jgi:hypothetical protein